MATSGTPRHRPVDKTALRVALGGRAVALELDIEAVAEDSFRRSTVGGKRTLACEQRIVDGAVRAAGEADEAVGWAVR